MKTEKKCTKCDEMWPIEMFREDKRYKDNTFCWCLDCEHKYHHGLWLNMSKQDREKRLKYNRESYAIHAVRRRAKKKEQRLGLKLDVLSHYSGGKPVCAYCGFDDTRALCLDHINNDGAEQRRAITGKDRTGGGAWAYLVAKSQGYPRDLQVLCANCNAIKENRRKQKVSQVG